MDVAAAVVIVAFLTAWAPLAGRSARSGESAITYLPCNIRGANGRFADTCFGVRLLPDSHTLAAAGCATDGSMARFRADARLDLDARINSFDGHLMVTLRCVVSDPTLPLRNVPCGFSRACRNVRLDVANPSSLGPNGTELHTAAVAWLYADCPDPDGNVIANQVDLNPYITNHRGNLEWVCQQ
jgi:hypothetical protein